MAAKVSELPADSLHMISPVSSPQTSQSGEAAKTPPLAATYKPPAHTAPQPSDSVTLKSTSNVRQDADGK